MTSIFAARYTMTADIEKPGFPLKNSTGQWSYNQDPESGTIVRTWVDNPNTTAIEGTTTTVECEVQSIKATGIRGNGTTERVFGEKFEELNIVRATFPPSVNITQRDRVTNVKFKKTGALVYNEAQTLDGTLPTVFTVVGVSPSVDPFGNLVEWDVLLDRSEVQ